METKNYKKISLLKKKKKKIVLCHGVFDLLHVGHVKYFEQAKKFGDILVVSVTSDTFVNKGPLRPVYNIEQRIELIKKLKVVDFVVKSDFLTAKEIIEKIRPDIYCKGPDYKNKINKDINLKKEIKAIKRFNGKFVTVQHLTQSSSKFINQANLDLGQDKLSNFLSRIRNRYDYSDLIKELKKIDKISSLVLGEMIIDKYNFADAVGRSGKDPMMVFKLKNEKTFLGGSGYIANLSSSFGAKTNHISHIGDRKSYLSFIKKKLSNKVNFSLLKKTNSPTILKLRYVDYYRNNKINGFYDINEEPLNDKEDKKYINIINKVKKKVNLIILADYGHGEISNRVIKSLQKINKRIYINTQLNSFNYGSHNLRKFKKVNTICINESELRFELRDKKNNITTLVKKFRKYINCQNVVVTQGKFGATIFTKKEKFFCPAFDTKPLDTIGSGDTLFTIISLCLASGIKPELSLIIASMAAALSTKNLGNDFNLSMDYFLSYLKTVFFKK